MVALFDSFEAFERRFGTPQKIGELAPEGLDRLRANSFPDFYLDYLEQNGLCSFNQGTWWLYDNARRNRFYNDDLDRARKRCRDLQWHEIYCFVPALAAGDSLNTDNIHRMPRREAAELIHQWAQ